MVHASYSPPYTKLKEVSMRRHILFLTLLFFKFAFIRHEHDHVSYIS